jgi:sRNA-binding protein
MQIARMRLCLTADRAALVPHGHQDAALLYAAIGDEIPDDAAERFGLVDGLIPGHADEAAIEVARREEEEAKAKVDADAQAKREADAAEAAKADAAAVAKAEADAVAKAEAKPARRAKKAEG